jgi:hypothetical protein
MTFVCMSRCRSHHNLCILQFDYERIRTLRDNPSLAKRRIEQSRQAVVAAATEGAWRAANPGQIAAWKPELIEQRRLRKEMDHERKLREQLGHEVESAAES